MMPVRPVTSSGGLVRSSRESLRTSSIEVSDSINVFISLFCDFKKPTFASALSFEERLQ